MEIAQTSQERRDILERSMIGGALSEDSDSQSFTDSQSETSSISIDIPFDISDQMNGIINSHVFLINHFSSTIS